MKRMTAAILFFLILCSAALADIQGIWQLTSGDTDLFGLVIHSDMSGEVYQAPDRKASAEYGSLLMSGHFSVGTMFTFPDGEVFAFRMEQSEDGLDRLILERQDTSLIYLHVPTLPQLFSSGEAASFENEEGTELTLYPDGTCVLGDEEGTFDLGLIRLGERELIFQFVPDSGDYLLLEAEGTEPGKTSLFFPRS